MGSGVSTTKKSRSEQSFFGDPLSEEDVLEMDETARNGKLSETGAASSTSEDTNEAALDSYIDDSIHVLCRRDQVLGPSDFDHRLEVVEVEEGDLKGMLGVQMDSLSWKSYYTVLAGTRLFLSDSESLLKEKKYKMILSVAWVCAESIDINILDGYVGRMPRLAEKMDQLGLEGRFRIFHPQGMVTARSDDGIKGSKLWLDGIQKMLIKNFCKEELTKKKDIQGGLEPLIFEQSMAHFEREESLINHMEEAGFEVGHELVHPMHSPEKVKFGLLRLKMSNDDEGNLLDKPIWRKFYFCLLPGHLYAFDKSTDEHASGHLYTKYCGVRRMMDDDDDVDDDGRKLVLKITTPLRTFEVKMKHETQLSEWVLALMKAGTKSNCGLVMQQLQGELARDLEAVYAKKASLKGEDGGLPQLWVHCEDGKVSDEVKKFDLNYGKNVLGRDASCEVQIKTDKSISRAHVLIEIRMDGNARVMDLESSVGTFLAGGAKGGLSPMDGLGLGDVLKVGSKTVLSIGEPDKDVLAGVLMSVMDRKKTMMPAKESAPAIVEGGAGEEA